ncbi:D-alanyl-D-alanine carboxypeptidase family protein [Clostridium cylindrosporum]|uniref:serine-type D-Ala-D-Ala carboxypeptidase n=1 Tax=Clostridium cylindrosporum DSM 605 TaxID=1121307 RepID=A0A0J8G1D2_CLOCY|nr:D-alanyl-D-alanine carboxypeptidase family protein [Clostridium cylindrosporum]KMT21561.1 D-alanyl-D-alanine carboxypeptidase DacB [Clostridium cylindrosporum DSM 605]
MIKKTLLSITLMLGFLLSFPYGVKAKAPIPNNITSEGYVLMDMDSGKILASKNENTKYEPASITKILTALIVIEKGNLKDKITIKHSPTLEEGSSLYLKEGEVVTVEQLLYGLMLKSGNDAATALAEYISGSKENFAKEMNKRAKELGAVNSHFSNPHGLNDNNHYTTPRDYSLIAKGAMNNPTFRKIVGTATYTIAPTPQFPQARLLVNHNKLISSQKYKYDGANGVKTGFTKRSLHTFVGSATKGHTNLLVVCMKNSTQCYVDTKTLFDYGFTNYESKKITEKGKVIGNMAAKNKKDINLIVSQDTSYPFDKSNPEKVSTDIKYLDIKKFHAGDVVAKLEIKINGAPYKTVDLKASKEYIPKIDKTLEKYGITDSNKNIIAFSASLITLFALLIVFNIRVKRNRNNIFK